MFAARAYQWGRGGGVGEWLAQLLRAVNDWLAAFSAAHPAGFVALLLALAAVLLAILVHLGWMLWRALHPRLVPAPAPALAAGVVRDGAWHLAQARDAARAGRFREALAHRFLALVAELDRRRVLTAHPARTPAEYVAAARLDPERRAAFAGLVGALYAHLYGGAPLDENGWRAFDLAAASLGGGRAAAV